MGRQRSKLRDARERKPSLAGAAAMTVATAASDPFALLFVLVVCGRFWKVGLILMALIATVVMITGFLALWMKHWDI
ncbi:hypothetical protein [Bradyrhizobium sp. HKCCYLS20291]|uniref:hypothetical protein n=1 Tax=Bradyrhizobium sp. HKCCYLS20291 TaxID=3420766 RepID=UPI003EBCCF8F